MLQLIRIATSEVVSEHDESSDRLVLPDGAGVLSPLVADWAGGGELALVESGPDEDGNVTSYWVEGAPRFRLRAP